MEAEPPPDNHHHDHLSTSGSLGYFHLRLLGPTAPLLLRSDRLYSLSFSRRRGHRLRLLAFAAIRHRRRRRRELLLITSGCVLRLAHPFSGADAVRVNGRPLHGGGGPVDLAVGDEVSLLLRGDARYGFVAEKFVSCEGGEKAAGSCKEVIVLRAESLRKRVRAISESHDPLSFLRDSHCLQNGSADVGVKKARPEDDFLCLENSINRVPEENLLREECNFDQDRLEHHRDVAKDDIVELPQRSKGDNNDNLEHRGCINGKLERHHTEGCYSDGSTFFLNRLTGIRPDMRA